MNRTVLRSPHNVQSRSDKFDWSIKSCRDRRPRSGGGVCELCGDVGGEDFARGGFARPWRDDGVRGTTEHQKSSYCTRSAKARRFRAIWTGIPVVVCHHVCYEVDDIYAARDKLVAEGARILGDGEPKNGAHDKPVLFLHPKDFCGTLIELEQA